MGEEQRGELSCSVLTNRVWVTEWFAKLAQEFSHSWLKATCIMILV
jgi:hypothetical protein